MMDQSKLARAVAEISGAVSVLLAALTREGFDRPTCGYCGAPAHYVSRWADDPGADPGALCTGCGKRS